MGLTCNIDARGKRVRLINGVVTIAIGVVVALAWAWPGESMWGWVMAGACFVAGAFMVFEARAGWCVVRAMGFKTRI